MGKTKVVHSNTQFCDWEQEAGLQKMDHDLQTEGTISGRNSGMDNQPKDQTSFDALFMNSVNAKVKEALANNNLRHQRYSGGAVAQRTRDTADKLKRTLNAKARDKEIEFRNVQYEAEQLQPYARSSQRRRWVILMHGLLAVAEGWFGYSALRYAGWASSAAVVGGIGIAVAVWIGAHFLPTWIMNASTRLAHNIRYATVLFLFGIGFIWLGYFRAGEYAYRPGYYVQAASSTTSPEPTVSAWGIAFVSLAFFWVAMYLSLHFYQTKEELNLADLYEDKTRKAREVQNEINTLHEKVQEVENSACEEMKVALGRFEYAAAMENRIAAIAASARANYIKNNIAYRTDGCPACFGQDKTDSFQTFFSPNKDK